MKTVKQQAAEARAAGRKRFLADQPCQYGHRERDGRGRCIGCSRRLRLRPYLPNHSRDAVR